MKSNWPMVSIMGILIIFDAWIGISLAFILFPAEFNPINNYISDLGHYGMNPIGAWVYNKNMIVGAILMLFFYIGMSEYKPVREVDQKLLRLIQILGIFSVFSAIMVAIISEDYWEPHTLWSIIFFATGFIISFIGVIFVYRQPSVIRGVVIFGLFATLSNILLLFILPYELKIFEWIVTIINQANVIYVALNYKYMINQQS